MDFTQMDSIELDRSVITNASCVINHYIESQFKSRLCDKSPKLQKPLTASSEAKHRKLRRFNYILIVLHPS